MTDNPPAFPQLSVESGKRDGHGDMIEPFTASQAGATMRDLYAMAALQGMAWSALACKDDTGIDPMENKTVPECVARAAFEVADAMLIERAKR